MTHLLLACEESAPKTGAGRTGVAADAVTDTRCLAQNKTTKDECDAYLATLGGGGGGVSDTRCSDRGITTEQDCQNYLQELAKGNNTTKTCDERSGDDRITCIRAELNNRSCTNQNNVTADSTLAAMIQECDNIKNASTNPNTDGGVVTPTDSSSSTTTTADDSLKNILDSINSITRGNPSETPTETPTSTETKPDPTETPAGSPSPTDPTPEDKIASDDKTCPFKMKATKPTVAINMSGGKNCLVVPTTSFCVDHELSKCVGEKCKIMKADFCGLSGSKGQDFLFISGHMAAE